MPKSKKRRRKDGKKLGNGLSAHNNRTGRAADIESRVTMQDLINLIAYQEYVKDGTIVDENVIVSTDGDIPVFSGEGENRRQIGTASHIPDDPEHLSIRITDAEAISQEILSEGTYSIGNPEDVNE